LIAPHPIGTVHLKNVRVPLDALIGQAGDGFSIAMATLDFFRSSLVPRRSGWRSAHLNETLQRVKRGNNLVARWPSFKKPKWPSLTWRSKFVQLNCWCRLPQKDRRLARTAAKDAAMAKLYATEAAQRVIDRAVQLHGGAGVVAGAVVERLYRELRPLRIYEGTSEIQKLVIARALLRE